jgi:hypothetical protein
MVIIAARYDHQLSTAVQKEAILDTVRPHTVVKPWSPVSSCYTQYDPKATPTSLYPKEGIARQLLV